MAPSVELSEERPQCFNNFTMANLIFRQTEISDKVWFYRRKK